MIVVVILFTLSVATATVSVDTIELGVPRYIVSTLTVAVATLSVNKLNDGRQCEHQVLYSVDTNGRSSNA